MSFVSPFFRSPFTDMTGELISHQWNGDPRCAKLEMKTLDCLEAYGLDRGVKKCEDLIYDFQECTLKTRENMRYSAMRRERERQIKTGERKGEEKFAPPPKVDNY